jgi:hypothetical protein
MKTNRTYLKGFAALALILMLAACPGLTGPGTGSGETIPHGKGLARIRLGLGVPVQSVRTALPGISGYYFTLEFTAPGKTTVSKTLNGSLIIAVVLEPAVWTLEVKAYANSGHTILKAKGSTIVSITAGTESNFDVYLTPAFSSGGTGTLDYNITIPASVSRAWFGLYPIDVPESVTETIAPAAWEADISTSAGGTASASLPGLPEGSYRAVIDLYDGGSNKAATWTWAAHIYSDSTTLLTREFTADDFAECGSLVTTGNTLAAKLDTALGYPTGSYTIALGSETDLAAFAPKILSVTGNKNITITIRGNGKTIQSDGSDTKRLFTLTPASGSTLTLVLQDITLRGLSSEGAPLVYVNERGTLVMKAGSLITGNTSSSNGGGVCVYNGTFSMSGGMVSNTSSSNGGGVYVYSGTFSMSGGAVSGNSSSSGTGGGVYIASNGTFTISGGAVSGNSSSSGTGGVYIASTGTFSMSGGAVSGNSSTSSTGGVYIASTGTFSMSGGAVSGNSSTSSYGGVLVSGGTFTMSGGAVNGNDSSSGGGVYVMGATGTLTFTMSGGAISGNTSSSGGGGVFVYGTTFSMSGGAVSGNTSSSNGGGVYIGSNGTFTMSGGAVSGNILSNTNNYGREVLVDGGTFNMSGEARPERVFLCIDRFITITGPLSGGAVPIDLGIGNTVAANWNNKSVLTVAASYGEGNLADLKTYFTLGKSKLTMSPYTETPITGYTIGDDGKLAAE